MRTALTRRNRCFIQPSLFCACGVAVPSVAGLCRRCYRRQAHSREKFGGRREEVLVRDAYQCRVCGSADRIAVHHRRPGFDAAYDLITLCAGCHARVHKLLSIRIWLPDVLLMLWAEQHPGAPLQHQFAFSA